MLLGSLDIIPCFSAFGRAYKVPERQFNILLYGEKCGVLTALLKKKPFDNLSPLILGQSQWKTMRNEIKFTLSTTSFSTR